MQAGQIHLNFCVSIADLRNRTFFPNVYNEDWFFMLDAEKAHSRSPPVARPSAARKPRRWREGENAP